MSFESKRHALAYLMGVYLSDGYIIKRGGIFGLEVKDVEFRDMAAAAMEMVGTRFTLSDREYPTSRGKQRVYRVVERSPYQIGWWLEGLYLTEKDHLPPIPDDLAHDLVAGIMDGDGSIYKRKDGRYGFAVCGYSTYLADLQVLFARFGVKMYYHPESPKGQRHINIESFVRAGFYFRMPRKQALVEAYRSTKEI